MGKTPPFYATRHKGTPSTTQATLPELQDTGLDGVTSEEERQHPRYSNYAKKVASPPLSPLVAGHSKMADPRDVTSSAGDRL